MSDWKSRGFSAGPGGDRPRFKLPLLALPLGALILFNVLTGQVDLINADNTRVDRLLEQKAQIESTVAAQQTIEAGPQETPNSASPSPVATSTPDPSATCEPSGDPGYCLYTVQLGDNLADIAARFGLDGNEVPGWELIYESNKADLAGGIEDVLVPGWTLRVPTSNAIVYLVLPGDSVSALAVGYDVTSEAIASANNLADPDDVQIGDLLIIPEPAEVPVEVFEVPDQADEPVEEPEGDLQPVEEEPVEETATEEEPAEEEAVEDTAEEDPADADDQGDTVQDDAAEESDESEDPEQESVQDSEVAEDEDDGLLFEERRNDERRDDDEQEQQSRSDEQEESEDDGDQSEDDGDQPDDAEGEDEPEESDPEPAPEQSEDDDEESEEAEAPQPEVDDPTRMSWPVVQPLYITNYMSARHPLGMDFGLGANPTSSIMAAAGGTVSFAGGDPCCSYGYYVTVDHGNGLQTLYAHFSSISVKKGDRVSRGQALGIAGDTGNSRGVHLHFEVYKNGTRVDPMIYLPGN